MLSRLHGIFRYIIHIDLPTFSPVPILIFYRHQAYICIVKYVIIPIAYTNNLFLSRELYIYQVYAVSENIKGVK